jgi:oxaloacetate decarboxylase alpha subunit
MNFSKKEVKFIDVTVRDGHQSLWGAAGMRPGMVLSIAPVLDRAGFKAIDFISSIHMGMQVRNKENPWEYVRLGCQAMSNTPLSFGTTGRRFIGFKRMPDSIVELVLQKMASYGIRRVWIIDAPHDVALITKVARMAKKAGIQEFVVALSYSISPVHTDEYYAKKADELSKCNDIDTFYIKDQGGLLTIDRIRTLVPVIQKNIRGKPLEIHSHCNTGLAPLVYLEAINMGVDVVHTAIPSLANGSSLPNINNILRNIRYMGYTSKINEQAIAEIMAHFKEIAQKEGLPEGVPVEYDAHYYKYQVPGGMVTTLQRHLKELGMEHRLEEVLEEIVRVRAEFGYPIMVTPFSQFMGTQATMNVATGSRYKVIPDELLQYVAGWFGEPPVPIDKDVLDKIASNPRAKLFFNKDVPQYSVAELRKQMGLGPNVSDEEFLLRYTITDKGVDEMLAAGPLKTTYP